MSKIYCEPSSGIPKAHLTSTFKKLNTVMVDSRAQCLPTGHTFTPLNKKKIYCTKCGDIRG
jgi:hypothetical protein